MDLKLSALSANGAPVGAADSPTRSKADERTILIGFTISPEAIFSTDQVGGINFYVKFTDYARALSYFGLEGS